MNRYYTYIKSRKSTGKSWGQGEKEVTEDEMVWWHRQLNGHEFAQTPEDSEGQESLVGCSPWHHKELDRIGDWKTTTKKSTLFLKYHIMSNTGSGEELTFIWMSTMYHAGFCQYYLLSSLQQPVKVDTITLFFRRRNMNSEDGVTHLRNI